MIYIRQSVSLTAFQTPCTRYPGFVIRTRVLGNIPRYGCNLPPVQVPNSLISVRSVAFSPLTLWEEAHAFGPGWCFGDL